MLSLLRPKGKVVVPRKRRMKKKVEAPPPEPYRYSRKISFLPGDKVRISKGPYFLTKEGTEISMGERGVYVFIREDESKTGIWVKKNDRDAPRFVYMGEERTTDSGTTQRPHKLVKIRK